MPILQKDWTTEGPAATQEEAKQRQIWCRFCDLQGQLTIYHRDYAGLPTMTVVDHNGEEKIALARIGCHCSCEVGRWMRHCSKEDVKRRMPILSEIGIGAMKNWSPYDPRLPEDDPDVVPDWAAFREWVRGYGKPVVRVVRPVNPGNRAAAFREMGEAIPGSKPPLALPGPQPDVPF